ncbi:MAG: hypothetical protein KDE32_07720 [Novosphingobium sp.]|nr:hypothetical protein [Novosphingobium sp.]
MNSRTRLTLTALVCATAIGGLAGCKTRGELVVDEGVGVTAVRSRCPAVGIPNFTGDVTLFGPSGQKTADNIDVVAVMTNVRSQCSEGTDQIMSSVSFDVQAKRTDTRGARQVTLPYFVSVVRGGSEPVSKRVGQVTISFADGQERASASGSGSAYVDAAEATLPAEIREKITRKRKAGEADAAVDPLNEPDVKAALARAEFELLLGFQLNQDQLAYNATR